MTAFPGVEATFTGFTASHTLAADSHASQHNLEQSEIIATQHKIGTGASTPTSGVLLRGNGAGTSSWSQVVLTTDVSGVLPQANGGTGTTLATGTGKTVYDTSPTISGAALTSSPTLTTPTIADFTNATHNHQTNAGGGTLNAGSALQSGTITLSRIGTDSSYTTTDISSTATIVGWSSFTTKQLRYQQVGKLVYMFMMLEGTSNSTTTTVTLPVTPSTNYTNFDGVSGLHTDNGTVQTGPRWEIATSGNVVQFYTSFGGGGWTASGTKQIRSIVIYEAA